LFTPIFGIVATAWQCSLEQGQIYIDEARYRDAIREFTCVIEGQPTDVEGYRRHIEAELLLFAIPVLSATTPHNRLRAAGPSGYAARLAAVPNDYSRSHRRASLAGAFESVNTGDLIASR
jgi:hypothetical protein